MALAILDGLPLDAEPSAPQVLEQSLQVLLLLALTHAVQAGVRLLVGGMAPGWTLIWAPVIEALLWPLATWLLLAPQRRAPDRDAHRPL